MIYYRPHKGTLADAMAQMQTFDTIDEMFDFIVKDWSVYGDVFTKEDLSVGEDEGKDDRIDWKETRYVCTSRMRNEVYDVPQCIGMCSFED